MRKRNFSYVILDKKQIRLFVQSNLIANDNDFDHDKEDDFDPAGLLSVY